jgi:glycosyltransferase involved in cell wall biosynthesis
MHGRGRNAEQGVRVRIVVAHSGLSTLGGGERVALELLRHLGRRHEVMLWAGGYRQDHTYSELASFPRRDLLPAEWLYRVPRADLVISHAFGAHLLALRHPVTICYVHSLRSRYLRGEARPDLALRRSLDRLALRRAAALVTNSAYSADHITRRYGRRAEVVPPGVAPAQLDVSTGPDSYALYAGRIAPEKGLERLIKWSVGVPLELRIAGAGAARYLQRLQALAGPRVRWLGPLRGEALAAAYAGARCVVILSEGEEFGLTALEGMAAARPVVALRSGGLPELVVDGVGGMVVDDSEGFQRAIGRLAADPDLAARMGRAGRDRARAYTWEAMTAAIERIGVAALESRHAGPLAGSRLDA